MISVIIVKRLNMKIAYQQLCASRYTFQKDKILDELFKRIGVERVNRKYDRINALYYGGPLASMVNAPKEKVD